jgi:hypothetical protein
MIDDLRPHPNPSPKERELEDKLEDHFLFILCSDSPLIYSNPRFNLKHFLPFEGSLQKNERSSRGG